MGGMRIVDVQRRLHEAGRIRIGAQVEGTRDDGSTYTRPAKLETFRFTSSNRDALRSIAVMYGGDVLPWPQAPTKGQEQLFTEAATIKILLPPEAMSFSQSYEQWSGGGCLNRCDGRYDYKNEEPCSCDPDARLCKPHTRLSVMLEGLPGAGLWRLETQGFNAMEEINGAFALATLITAQVQSSILPATLRLDQRMSLVDGQTKQFVVPVIDFDIDMAALSRGGLTPVAALGTGAPALSLGDQLQAVDAGGSTPKPRANGAEPVAPTGIKPRTMTQAERVIDPELTQAIHQMIDGLAEDEKAQVREAWKVRFSAYPVKMADGLTKDEANAAMTLILNTVDGSVAPNGQRARNGSGEPFPEDASEPQVARAPAPRGARGQASKTPQNPRDGELGASQGTTAARPTTQISTKQVGMIRAKLANEGVHDDVHDAVGMILGGIRVDSLNDLTKAQASKVIDALIDREG